MYKDSFSKISLEVLVVTENRLAVISPANHVRAAPGILCVAAGHSYSILRGVQFAKKLIYL